MRSGNTSLNLIVAGGIEGDAIRSKEGVRNYNGKDTG